MKTSALTVAVLAAVLGAVPAGAQAPKRMIISVENVDVASSVFLTASQQVTAGPDHDARLLAALLKGGAQKPQSPMLMTIDGESGRLSTRTVVPPAASGLADSLTLENYVEIGTRTNEDGTITAAIKAQREVLTPGVTPTTVTTNTLSTTRTLRDGQETLIGGVLDPTDSSPTTHLTFMKVSTAVH